VTRSFSPFVHERVCLTSVHTHTHTHTHTALRAPISFLSLLSPVKQVLSHDSRFSPEELGLASSSCPCIPRSLTMSPHHARIATPVVLALAHLTRLTMPHTHTHTHTHTHNTHTHAHSLTFFQPAPLQQALTAIRHRAWALMDTRASFTEAFRGCRWLPPTWGRRLQAVHRGATQCRT
jgi:hypothetical protein